MKTNTKKATGECIRCGGAGWIQVYSHVQGGICFKCGGAGGRAPAAPAPRTKPPVANMVDVYDSSSFDWVPARCQLVAEMSTLQFKGCQKLSPMANDVGFDVRSAKTGAVIRYKMVREIREPAVEESGDLLALEFAPVEESCKKHPACLGTRVILLND